MIFSFFFFFFNDTATTEIYTLSLHDALPISLVDFRPCRRCADRAGIDALARFSISAADACRLEESERAGAKRPRSNGPVMNIRHCRSSVRARLALLLPEGREDDETITGSHPVALDGRARD